MNSHKHLLQLFQISFIVGVAVIIGYKGITLTALRKANNTLAATSINYYGKQIQTFGLLGQAVLGSSTKNKVSASTIDHAPGVVVDTSSSPNKVYVVDSGNSRILGYKGIGSCSNNNALICTTNSDCGSGNTCSVPAATINTKPADIIIGQPDAKSGACNGDDNLGWNKKPTASTLCLLAYPWGNNTAEQWQANNIDVDNQGNLFVTDTFNNRVLKFNQPLSSDTTNGKGDAVADFVWGQNDFNSNGRNRGSNNGWGNVAPPDDHSLWAQGHGPSCTGTGSAGVSVDSSGNVWVSDDCNHRIMRFPGNSQTADLVIGQPNFTSTANDCNGTTLNTLCGTVQARVDPVSGDLYVMDRYTTAAFISRILVYHAPFTNGMSAYKVIIPKAGNFVDWGGWDGKGTYMFQGSGFTFNPDKANYPNGVLWVTEHDANRVLLIDNDGNILKVINAVDANHRGGTVAQGCPFYSDNGNGMGYGLYWPSSAVSFDSENNIYITAEEFSTSSHISRYSLPYNSSVISNGNTCLPLPNGGLNWVAPLSTDTLTGGRGLILYQNQLISLHDQSFQNVYGGDYNGVKVMAWDNFQTKQFGAAAENVINKSGIVNHSLASSVDDKGRLWALSHSLLPIIYQLPITSSSQAPLANYLSQSPLYWADDGTPVTGTYLTGFSFDPINKIMYIIDHGSRILRVKNYDQYATKLNVDMVIGQKDKTNTSCNQGLSAPNAGTLCEVREAVFDKLGNLFVVDDNYECHGNRRITMFTAQDLQSATGMFPNLQAKKVFNEPDFSTTNNCSYWVHDAPGTPVSIAFDSHNHMIVGNDGYYDQPYDSERELKQLWYYADPINKQTPDASISLYMGTPGDMVFDAQDNLVIQDTTWSRIQMINLCTDPQWLSFLPGVTPTSPCAMQSSSPTPTITPTATPTRSPSPTPTKSPTPKPTATPTKTPTPKPTATPTKSPTPVPLSISSIIATPKASSAVITWQTNFPANSRISYGKNTNLLQTTATNSQMVTTHSMTITGLSASTQYYYRIYSVDALGRQISSSIQQFRTKNR